jgi:uncharacterized protein YbaP (TraB family)
MNKNKNTLLWKITKPGRNHVSYLFGTIHIWNPEIERIYHSVLPFMNACNLFAAESDLSEIQSISGDFFLLNEGLQLHDFFKPRKFDKLSLQLRKKFGISIETVQQMSPFALYSSLGKNFVETGNSSLDEKLWQFALENGKTAIGVETTSEQMSYYGQIPMIEQAEMLYELVMKSANFRRKFNRMVRDYLQMDIVALYKNSKKGYKFIRKLLVYRRNDIMSNRIAEITYKQSAFIGLGAGHLAGKRGIIKQLKDRGFRVKPVSITISENNTTA